MTDQQPPALYRRTDSPGLHFGVPDRDLTADEFAALPPDLRREVKSSPLYELTGATEAPRYTLDPLRQLDDAAWEALTPAEKGQRTKEANRLAEEAADGQNGGE
jgi:hypothetical protein